ncbi:unnamed protein product [Moneuplotes crassus]|uniref:Uncharacterized protein n=1 Tax=Euplotes crassus TaxID=5936 RepID=A0AAD2D9F2_EUPCR|nr:unnamed protein product [Moneuplotes crassus]
MRRTSLSLALNSDISCVSDKKMKKYQPRKKTRKHSKALRWGGNYQNIKNKKYTEIHEEANQLTLEAHSMIRDLKNAGKYSKIWVMKHQMEKYKKMKQLKYSSIELDSSGLDIPQMKSIYYKDNPDDSPINFVMNRNSFRNSKNTTFDERKLSLPNPKKEGQRGGSIGANSLDIGDSKRRSIVLTQDDGLKTSSRYDKFLKNCLNEKEVKKTPKGPKLFTPGTMRKTIIDNKIKSILRTNSNFRKSSIISNKNHVQTNLNADSLKKSFELIDKNFSAWKSSRNKNRSTLYSSHNRHPLLSDISFQEGSVSAERSTYSPTHKVLTKTDLLTRYNLNCTAKESNRFQNVAIVTSKKLEHFKKFAEFQRQCRQLRDEAEKDDKQRGAEVGRKKGKFKSVCKRRRVPRKDKNAPMACDQKELVMKLMKKEISKEEYDEMMKERELYDQFDTMNKIFKDSLDPYIGLEIME